MAKENKNIICEGCDSEYRLTYAKNMVSAQPSCCPFCGEETEVEETDFDDLDDDHESEADDY
jgi:hydrogenase maturation factor HypF (carbamoyltransferase family)